MKNLIRNAPLLTTVSLGIAISFSVAVPQVQAQSFLERLFKPSLSRKAKRAEQAKPKQAVKAKKIKPAKIRGHTYFTYKPQRLKAASLVTLASLSNSSASLTAESSGNDGLKRSGFLEATKFLAKYAPLAEKSLAKAVVDYYMKNPEFIWVKNSQPTDRANSVLAVLRDADAEGLRAEEYVVSASPPATTESSPDANMEQLIKFEISLTMRALRYAQDARFGRINPNKLSEYHYFPDRKINSAKMLSDLISADDAAGFLQSLSPQNDAYKALKAELAKVRTEKQDDDIIVIKKGTFMRPGAKNPELANVIRGIRKFGSEELVAKYETLFAAYDGSPNYNGQYVELVKDFQREKKLNDEGIIGRKTIGMISEQAPKNKVASVIYSMERLRWHPSDFGTRYVFINTAAFRATYYNNRKEELSMDVIVGKKSNQTNFFYDEIEKVVYNPYWGVPRTILVNVKLPKLRRDAAYFDKNGYEVTTRSGKRIKSASVDWNTVGANFGYNVRQKPGPNNALGSLKILFPNKFVVYMHDTPSRGLFNNIFRAFSYGCIRLKRPREMAAAVLGMSVEEVAARVKAGKNATQFLKKKIPVYVSYFTAWPDSSGKIKYYADTYGRDDYLQKAMDKTSLTRTAQS